MASITISDDNWKKIANRTSFTGLLKLRMLNKNLNVLAEKLLHDKNYWAELCRTDKVKPWNYQATGFLIANDPLSREEEDEFIWKKIYNSFLRWKIFGQRFQQLTPNQIAEIIEYDGDDITTCDLYGNFIAVGTRVGSVRRYNLSSKKEMPMYDTNFPVKSVRSFHVGADLATFVMNYNQLLTYDNNGILIDQRDFDISLYSQVKRKGRGALLFNRANVLGEVSVNRNYNFRYKTLCGIRQKRNPKKVWEIIDFVYGYGVTTVVAVSDRDLLIHTLTRIQCYRKVFYDLMTGIRLLNIISAPTTNLVLAIDGKWLHVFTRRMTENQWIRRSYQLTDSLTNNISSVVMHANLLFFGTITGEIVFSELKEIQGPTNNEFEELSFTTIPIDPPERITALLVSEVDKKPHLIATTPHSVYSIAF